MARQLFGYRTCCEDLNCGENGSPLWQRNNDQIIDGERMNLNHNNPYSYYPQSNISQQYISGSYNNTQEQYPQYSSSQHRPVLTQATPIQPHVTLIQSQSAGYRLNEDLQVMAQAHYI
jgi:hypothetical protein